MRTAYLILFASIAAGLHAQDSPREKELQIRIDSLEKRLAEVEAKLTLLAGLPPPAPPPVAATPVGPTPILTKEAEPGVNGFFRDTTLNATVDGYYAYNFNRPSARENQLRAFDQSHNSFSLNQATLVLERAPNIEAGRRFGARIDLQFGQATQTLQGSPANENRPEIYRALFQAYGSYVFPIGSGLQADFGKFASSLGFEGNFTKDQMNYSRSLWFNYLPYYHFGFRNSYNFSPKVSAQYWLVNGANQIEDFNGFKSQAFQVTAKPSKALSWTATYFYGQETRPATDPYVANGLPSGIPPSFATVPVDNNGRNHIFDTYLSWTPGKFTAVLEGDYTINRNSTKAAPARVNGGAAYLQYQATPKLAFASRFELLQDRAGSFSGKAQTLKELTLTGSRTFADGFQAKLEYRRDFSNLAYFTSDRLGMLNRHQDTATLGLIWWFGGKTGSW